MTPWTVAHQAPLSMGFPRQVYWSDTISFSRDLPDSGTEPTSSVFPALAGGFFTTAPPGKPSLVLITPALIGHLLNVFYTFSDFGSDLSHLPMFTLEVWKLHFIIKTHF